MKKTTYVDGYLVVVKKKNIEAYKKMATDAAQMWLKRGAISVKECIGDDLTPDLGGFKVLQFQDLMNIAEDETVWYSYIEYESKEDRDRINAAVHEEMNERQKENPKRDEDMPFEMNRMAFGGFRVEVG